MKTRFVFYRDRPEWADVTPVPQDEEGRVVVKIAYSAEFVDAHDYFRAVLLKDERSERALELTSTILYLNPANYTAFEYRRRILTTLQSDLMQELKFVSELLENSSKNYQLWHHRQWIVIQIVEKCEADGEKQSLEIDELQFTADIIADDSKQYHAWQHRRWVINYFKVSPLGELTYTQSLINKDVYNNSAWNHRFVTVTRDEGLTPTVLQREVDFVQQMICKAPANDSAWNYLYGLLVPPPSLVVAARQAKTAPDLKCPRPDLPSFTTSTEVVDETAADDDDKSAKFTQLIYRPPSAANLRKMRQFAEDLAASDKTAGESAALWSFLVEVYTDCIQSKQPNASSRGRPDPTSASEKLDGDANTEGETISQLIDLGVSACECLANELDRVRVNYWRYRSRQLQSLALEYSSST